MKKNVEKALKIIRLEKKKGFTDEAIIGGIEKFIRNQFADERILGTVKGYEGLSNREREKALEELENLLRGADEKEESPEVKLDDPVEEALGVGKKRGEAFRDLSVETIEDLLFFFPRKIEDRREKLPIAKTKEGDKATVVGEIKTLKILNTSGGMKLVKAAVEDSSGILYGVWYNQPWVKKQLSKGEKVALFGKISVEYGQIQMENPVWEPAEEKKLTRKLVPLYPSTEGISQKNIRWIIERNLKEHLKLVPELAPPEALKEKGFGGRKEALKKIHKPEKKDDYEEGRKTLAFHELYLFYFGLGNYLKKDREGKSFSLDRDLLEDFRENIPFRLTDDQTSALEEIYEDLKSDDPMNRLLQGDVGTGKTIVAAGAGYLASASGFQTAFMAPTTVLAEQHFSTFRKVFDSLPVTTELLTGNTGVEKRKEIKERLREGEIDFLVGTHALLEEDVRFNDLGLSVVDEEQRFGVGQRSGLKGENQTVNSLVMSATPIPRTITSTIYGEFETSRLQEMPRGEKDVETYWVGESKRNEVYDYIYPKLEKDHQAFIIFPLIEESEKTELKSAKEMKKKLSRNQLKDLDLGLLHGEMDEDEKRKIVEKTEAGELDALISTTVIEVGIDIPRANILVIEEADRFGLTQLHQLRGRIGRSGDKAYCFAIASPSTEKGRRRLKVFRDESDGFKIVEEDLKIRGPGDLLGPDQHGFRNSFYACDLLKDYEIMETARKEAERAEKGSHQIDLSEEFERYYGKKIKWIKS